MSETKIIDIKALKFDEHNFNKHNKEGMSLLGKSIKENGFGRSILLDKDDNIVGGNGVTEKAMELGTTKVRIIETDGTELIAVKRTDLALDSKEGRQMALADNAIANVNLEWDTEELAQAESDWGVLPEDWGVELPDFETEEDNKNELSEKYSQNIGKVVYEPKETHHTVAELYTDNSKKFDELIETIQDEELKKMLRLRATWFVDFNFSKIADYYAYQATEEEQKCFEALGLVLLDLDGLIENGFSDLIKDYDDEANH